MQKELIPIGMKWPSSLYEELRLAAFERHIPMTAIVQTALREWLAREDEKASATR